MKGSPSIATAYYSLSKRVTDGEYNPDYYPGWLSGRNAGGLWLVRPFGERVGNLATSVYSRTRLSAHSMIRLLVAGLYGVNNDTGYGISDRAGKDR